MTTNFDRIPEWDSDGLLPPYLRGPTFSRARSPYRVPLPDLILRLGTSNARREILAGFLDFRSALHSTGLVDGFQWVNGSFVENVMRRRGREPNDIDVVTFFRLPSGQTQESLSQSFPTLINPVSVKRRYHVDSHYINLGTRDMRSFAGRVAYWNGLWSHTRRIPSFREHQWKGYLEVDLSDGDDADARDILNGLIGEEDAQ